MAICPKCKAENRPEAAFCAQCGAILLNLPAPTKSILSESAPDITVTSEPARAEPLISELDSTVPAPATPLQQEQPINEPAEQPAPPPTLAGHSEGTIFQDRFSYNTVIYLDEHEIRYTVNEIQKPSIPGIRKCSNSSCRTIHPPTGTEQEKFCTQCGYPLEQEPPLLLLFESDIDQYSYLQQIIDINLVFPCLHSPISVFQEALPEGMRYYLVTPYSQEVPPHPDALQVLGWGKQLADGLDYLHAHGVVLGDELDPSCFGVVEERIVWRYFKNVRILPMLTDRDKINDVRLLALILYSWMTGKDSFSHDPALSPALNELFHRALIGEGFMSGGELAGQINQVIKAGISPLNLDYHVGRLTHTGQMRSKNEDSLVCISLSRVARGISQPAGIFAVADGMGGHATGDLASSLTIQAVIQKAFSEIISLQNLSSDEYNLWLKQTVQASNRAVFETRQNEGNDMGSTLICALLLGNQAYLAHIGDSRAYLIREGSIQQLTTDHSLVQHMVEIGQISQHDARKHPQRNVIYRSLGDKPQVEADLFTQSLLIGDKLLLCSDGLSGMVDDKLILKMILEASSPQQACDRMIEAANQAGGDDNITAILIEVISA